MKINGKVYCFFEQSGVFKNEFVKLSVPAEDYDIQNEFGQTDHICDLFAEIENAYNERPSVFDSITSDDLIMAFFPCVFFTAEQMGYYHLIHPNTIRKPLFERINDAIERVEKRTKYHVLLYKLVYATDKRHLRLIIENPATAPNYLVGTRNFPNPTFIDYDRTRRGDYFVKPTAYWFFGCSPTHGCSYQVNKERRIVRRQKMGRRPGVCSTERSSIAPMYARNFICDFILGKKNEYTMRDLFDDTQYNYPNRESSL